MPRLLLQASLLVALATGGAASGCHTNLVVGSEFADAAASDAVSDRAAEAAPDSADQADVAAIRDAAAEPAGEVINPALARGLVVYWKLDDLPGTSKVLDSSGQLNNASPEAFSGTDWQQPGHRDGALLFGPAGWVYVSPSASLDAISTTVSISLWMNLAATSAGQQIVVARQKGSTAEVDFALRLRDGYLGFAGATLDPPSCESPTRLPLGRMMAVAATYDGAFARIFVDGAEAIACPMTGTFPTDGRRLSLGGRYTTAADFDVDQRLGPAVVDEVMLHDRALTAGEVGALAAGQLPL
jgi:hypothetical protein